MRMGGDASLGWDGGVGAGTLGDNGEIVGDIDGWGIMSWPFCYLGLHVADVGIMCIVWLALGEAYDIYMYDWMYGHASKARAFMQMSPLSLSTWTFV